MAAAALPAVGGKYAWHGTVLQLVKSVHFSPRHPREHMKKMNGAKWIAILTMAAGLTAYAQGPGGG